MAATVHSGVPQQPLDNKRDEELINSIISLILIITGNPPVDASHVYRFKMYVYDFLHPYPKLRYNTGGTVPTPYSYEPIAESLHGWEDVLPEDNVQAVFQFFPEDDQKLACDHFFRKLCRRPRVLEFSRFLLNFQGNQLTDSSHKTLGQLFLENEELRKTLDSLLKTMELLEQMLSSKDAMIQALGQSNDQNKKDLDNLQNQWIYLERIVRSIQHQKEDLQFEYNVLKRRHDQCPSEVEDERKDKQVFKHRCEQLQADKLALQNSVTSQSDTIILMQFTIHEHEHNIDRLTDKVKDLRKKLHDLSRDKSVILQELKEKSELVSKLEEDREIFMMENEAQGKYVSELMGEKMRLQKENNVLKESVEMCKIILAEQCDTIIQSMEASLFTLNENLTKMKKTNAHLSETVVDLESKTEQQSVTISDLESKNSDLESKTEQQSVTISDLESKNSDLESKTEHQSVTILDLENKTEQQCVIISDLESKTEQQCVIVSDLESKNSDLESKTEQQSVTISDLESKNSDLESKNSDLQQKMQRQQYFLILAALIFAAGCLLFFFQGKNLPTTS